jgi:hypothetical protein
MMRLKVLFAGAMVVVGGFWSTPSIAQNVVQDSGRPAVVPSGYLETPFGYVHPSCVFHLDESEEVRDRYIVRRDGSSRELPPCVHPRYDRHGREVVATPGAVPPLDWGWIEYASRVVAPVEWMSATWTTPPAPRVVGSQTLYYFPGLEAMAQPDFILQPVLGWNAQVDNRWTIASWNCCRNGNALHSTLVPVPSGASIAGYVWGSDCDALSGVCATWQVQTSIAGGASTTLNTDSYGDAMDWAFGGAFEVYALDTCTQLPPTSGITFDNLTVQAVGGGNITPQWLPTVTSVTPSCNYSVTTNTPSTLTLKWCVPATCSNRCGTISNGCGGTITCGCSGSGVRCFDPDLGEYYWSRQSCVSGVCKVNPCW